MKNKVKDYSNVPAFLNINDAVKVTGLSSFSLRRGCKDGTIPHIKVGDKYMINIPKLLERDDSASVSKVAMLRRATPEKNLVFKHTSIPYRYRITI